MMRGQYAQGDDMHARFHELLAQIRLADKLGFNSYVMGQHYSTSPLQMLQQAPFMARAIAEAPSMRVVAGIVLIPLHKPLDIAEQHATIDVMSNGKLIFGAGLGYREVEFRAFGTTQKDAGARLEEGLVAIKRLWTEDTVDMVGSHFELKGASVSVRPIQKPHPPIWIGANADSAIRRAAQISDAWYVNPHNRLDTIERQVEVYKRALDDAGKPFPAEFPMMREVFVAPTREEAIRNCAPTLGTKYKAYHQWGQDKVMPKGDDNFDLEFEELTKDRFLLGAPDEVAEQIIGLAKRFGVTHTVLGIQFPGMAQSLITEQMELLAAEVFPKVEQGL